MTLMLKGRFVFHVLFIYNTLIVLVYQEYEGLPVLCFSLQRLMGSELFAHW